MPFALQVFRSGQAQNKEPAPLDTMFYQQSETGNLAKRFGMTLRTNGGTCHLARRGLDHLPLVAEGEVVMFSPYIDPNRVWKDEYSGSGSFSDWDSGSRAVAHA